jgi:lipid-A-disaccharide synthase
VSAAAPDRAIADRPSGLTGRRVLVSCGEASGDLYAGALARELRAIDPSLEISGFGGQALGASGAALIGDYRGFAVTGLVEAARVLPRSWRMLRTIGAAARECRPDVFVAIDFPDFNFRLLPVMHELGIPIVYYVSPQIWAWRPQRISVLRRFVSRMLVIFPFEVEIYERAAIPVEFVGHPLVDLAHPSGSREAFLGRNGLDPSRPILALLPGSRPNEIRRILPVIEAARASIAQQVPGVQFLLARAPALSDGLFEAVGAAPDVTVVTGVTDDVLAAADAVVTASGTATVQTALHGKPMVIVYRLSPATYAIGRRLVRLPHVGMVNLVAQRAVVPELIQQALTPQALAREAVSLLTDTARAARMRTDLAEVRAKLGGAGASRRAARSVLAIASASRLT